MERELSPDIPQPEELQARLKRLIDFMPQNIDISEYEANFVDYPDFHEVFPDEEPSTEGLINYLVNHSSDLMRSGRKTSELNKWWSNELKKTISLSKMTDTGKKMMEVYLRDRFVFGRDNTDTIRMEELSKVLGLNEKGNGIFQEEGLLQRELVLFHSYDEIYDVMVDYTKLRGIEMPPSVIVYPAHFVSESEGYDFMERRNDWRKDILDKYEFVIE